MSPPDGRSRPDDRGGSRNDIGDDVSGSVALAEDDPVEAAFPGFRLWQRGWRARIDASRRLPALEDGTLDPVAPGGRWGEW